MDAGLRFAVLGPMELANATGAGLPLPGPRQRALLAALLLSANVPVSGDALAEAIWEGSPPPGAAATLRSHIRRLREALGPEAGARIAARAPGYLIRVGQPELDVLRFGALCREAGTARRAARWAEVSAAATHALELWRGTPLLDVPSQMLRDEAVPRLEQMRLQALEDRAEADLRLHQHDRLIPELRDLAAEHPLRERFHAQLIEALARTGRQAEALDAYQQARQALVDKLGIEPGPELQLLQRRILAGDPALLTPPPRQEDTPAIAGATAHRGPAATVVPRQLPAAMRHFTGRDATQAELTALLGAAQTSEAAVVVAAIDGAPGVGKTALAVRWAHQVAAEFPDGQLYVNLQGFDPSGEIVQAQTAIRGFLDAFGVPSDHVPSSPQAQAGLYRSLLAGKRVLIVADNARDAAQVRPLLPGSPGCLVVVTSRARLTGLAASDGANLLTLGVMPTGEAGELLARRVGAGRATAESAAIDELARLCGRLPLALTVAAAQAAARPGMSLTALTAELADAAGSLRGLETTDPATDVRTVFSWSCQTLPDLPARTFRLLSIHPGPDITIPAAAALLAVKQDDARAALGTLAMANLIDEHVPGRFTVHDLLRAYAAEQAAEREPPAERLAAIQRVLNYYLHTSHAAALLLNPYRVSVPVLAPLRPGGGPGGGPGGPGAPERLDGHPQALAWFEAEHQVLLGCVSLAAETGSDACAWILPWAMTEFLDRRGHWHEWAAIQHTALAAATRLGDLAGQATARRALATACIRLTDYRQARAHLAACLRLHRQLGDRSGEALARHSLGRVAEHQGRCADALRHEQQALGLFRDADDQAGQALALNAIGWYHLLLGRPEQARTFCQQALTLYRDTGRRVGQAQAWDSLGYAEHHLGRLDHATACYQQALGIFRDLGELFGQADTLARLGDTRAAAADLPAARDAWQQALSILEDLHHPDVAQVRAKLRQFAVS